MHLFKLNYFLGLFAVASAAFAQGNYMPSDIGGLLIGRVYDAETLEPLADANVYLEGLGIGAATTRDGRFIIEAIAS